MNNSTSIFNEIISYEKKEITKKSCIAISDAIDKFCAQKSCYAFISDYYRRKNKLKGVSKIQANWNEILKFSSKDILSYALERFYPNRYDVTILFPMLTRNIKELLETSSAANETPLDIQFYDVSIEFIEKWGEWVSDLGQKAKNLYSWFFIQTGNEESNEKNLKIGENVFHTYNDAFRLKNLYFRSLENPSKIVDKKSSTRKVKFALSLLFFRGNEKPYFQKVLDSAFENSQEILLLSEEKFLKSAILPKCKENGFELSEISNLSKSLREGEKYAYLVHLNKNKTFKTQTALYKMEYARRSGKISFSALGNYKIKELHSSNRLEDFFRPPKEKKEKLKTIPYTPEILLNYSYNYVPSKKYYKFVLYYRGLLPVLNEDGETVVKKIKIDITNTLVKPFKMPRSRKRRKRRIHTNEEQNSFPLSENQTENDRENKELEKFFPLIEKYIEEKPSCREKIAECVCYLLTGKTVDELLNELNTNEGISKIFETFSFKTVWVLFRCKLENAEGYQDNLAAKFFLDEEIRTLKLQDVRYNFLANKTEILFEEEEQENALEMLDAILLFFVKYHLLTEEQLNTRYSTPRDKRRDSVIQNLQKNSFEEREIIKLVEYLTERDNGLMRFEYDNEATFILLKLLTGLPNNELLALKWSDIHFDELLEFAFFTIHAKFDGNKAMEYLSDGKEIKFRNFPITNILLYSLTRRLSFLKEHYEGVDFVTKPILFDYEKNELLSNPTQIEKKYLGILKIPKQMITLLYENGEEEEVDLNQKQRLFESNFMKICQTKNKMSYDEVAVLRGNKPHSTMDANYFAYFHPVSLLQLKNKLERFEQTYYLYFFSEVLPEEEHGESSSLPSILPKKQFELECNGAKEFTERLNNDCGSYLNAIVTVTTEEEKTDFLFSYQSNFSVRVEHHIEKTKEKKL